MPADDTHAIRNGDLTVTAPTALGAALLYRAAVGDSMALATLINLATQAGNDDVTDMIKEIHAQVARLTAEATPANEGNAE